MLFRSIEGTEEAAAAEGIETDAGEDESAIAGRKTESITEKSEKTKKQEKIENLGKYQHQDKQPRESKPFRDILDVLPYFAKQNPALHQDLPSPFGGIGYLSYEFARFCDTVHFDKPPSDPISQKEAAGEESLIEEKTRTEEESPEKETQNQQPKTYDAEFLFGHMYIIFDHYTDLIYIIGVNYREAVIDLPAALMQVERRINDLDFNYLSSDNTAKKAQILGENGVEVKDLRNLHADAEALRFKEGVRSIRDHIIQGDLLQGVLSRRLRIKTELSAFDAYRQLRSINPSPYMFYLDFPDHQLFGTSPEVMVKVKNGKAVLRPIAGTRRRGETAEEDLRLEQELREDEKERAEHLMLVDLARNDLGRVCKPGTVKVTEYMGVERYSHLMHLVSEVEGELRDDVEAQEVIRASFPAGTVSGAPKIRAMEIIDGLEKNPRGFYAGLVGYMEADGNFDTCIAIRTALRHKANEEIILQAGAGIVYDSNPDRELEETDEKLRALAAAIGLEL